MDARKNEIHVVSVKMGKEEMKETTKKEEKKQFLRKTSRKGVCDMAQDPRRGSPTNVGTDPKLEEEIRLRAYVLYEQRGRENGHDLDDWLHAEAELTAQAIKAAA